MAFLAFVLLLGLAACGAGEPRGDDGGVGDGAEPGAVEGGSGVHMGTGAVAGGDAAQATAEATAQAAGTGSGVRAEESAVESVVLSSGESAVEMASAAEIVESGEAQWQPGLGWRLGAEPRFELGSEGSGPEYQFWWIARATVLSDGRLVVLDREANNVRIFGPTGAHLATFGRKGSGPGELQWPTDLVRLPGDTLVVLDSQHRFSLSTFTGQGEYIDRVPMPPDFLAPIHMSALGILLADGSFLYNATTIEYQKGLKPGRSREPVGLMRAEPSSRRAVIDTVGWFDGVEMFDNREMGMLVPFPAGLLYERGPGGIYVGHMETGEVLRYDYEGRLRQTMRPRLPRRRLTGADYNRYRTRLLESVRASERAKFERWLADLPRKAEMPALGDLHIDVEGNIWLEHYRPSWERLARWTVLDPAGRTLGEVEGPEGLRILEVGADYFVGLWKDEFDVQYLRVYDLIKG